MEETNIKLRLAFIGAGNVAWHLAQALANAGHTVAGIYSRKLTSGEELISNLPAGTKVLPFPDFTALAIDIVLIAVPDAALAAVASEIKVTPGTIVAHTSGSQPLAILESIPDARPAVFYPLQTFSKSKSVDLTQAPILLETREPETMPRLQRLAQSISNQVHQVNSQARQQLHLAAVFACNFTNHLLGISQQLLQEASLPAALLHPLVQETVAKAMEQNPYTVQTGPAIRNDLNVIQAHLQSLQAHPRFKELYLKLTESIQATKV